MACSAAVGGLAFSQLLKCGGESPREARMTDQAPEFVIVQPADLARR
jgi:hypothetical protein